MPNLRNDLWSLTNYANIINAQESEAYNIYIENDFSSFRDLLFDKINDNDYRVMLL